jgi:trimeric autotransporter adhesin
LWGRRLAGPVAGLFIWFAASCVPLAAQDIQDTEVPADSQLAGTVRAPDGTAVPGSTLRITETSTGKAWITWADEAGSYEFPALPAGHYRVEISQLGFAPASQEVDLTSGVKTPFDLKLDVGTLAAISASAAAETAAKGSNAPAANESAESALPSRPAPNGTPPSVSNPATSAKKGGPSPAPGPRNGTGGEGGGRREGQQGGPGGYGQGGGRRAFQQLGLNGQAPNSEENSLDEQAAATSNAQLGQAASADAVQMIGTVAMGQMPADGGFVQGEGGPGGPGGFGPGGPGGPGQGPPGGPGAGMGGPGGPGGPGGGPGVVVQRGGGGRGRGGGGGSPEGPLPGVDALWGVQRLNRLRANQVHFSFYDTFGDSALNARPYSLTEANPPKISSWTDTAGMNMGGPLRIPHVYNGADKTFFYINFSGTWSRSPIDEFATVPTAAERAGDFSADNVLLYDPNSNLTGPRTLMSNAGCGQDAASAPGTCVPTTRISQQSLSLLNYIPLPNLPGETLNFHLQTRVPGVSNRLNVNVTHQISPKLSLQVNYNLSNSTAHTVNNFPGLEANTFGRGQSATVGLNQNWTKSFLHTSTLYFTRFRQLGLNEFSNVTDISQQLGITGVSPQPFDFGLPLINLTNFTGLSDPTPYLSRSQTYRYVDGSRWMKTKHTVNVGAEVRKMDINRDTDPTPNGQFSFTGLMTSQLTSAGRPDPSVVSGNDFADFLLGYPGNTKVQFGDTSTYFRNWGFVGYASDDWHIVPKFTLTYGVRYEAFTPPTEINGHIANLAVSSNFTEVQCVTPVATGNCVAGPNASLFHGHYNNWAPRLGIAWQPPGKWFSGNHQMTVRAGFSMFYVQAYLNTLAAAMANQPPFATADTLATLSGTNPTLLTLANGFPSSATPTNALTNTVAVDPNYKVPYATVWNLGVEYNLARNTFLEVMYWGTRGVHLDQLFGYSLATNTSHNAAGFTYDTSGAFSNMNALQVRLQKRMSHGIMFFTRYTFSKSLDDASTIGGSGQTVIQNNADPVADYGLSSFNMTHQFFGMFMYQLPFGDRQRFATKGWRKDVFGSWRVNGSFSANSGSPFTVRVFSKNQACQNVPGINSERADEIASAALANPTLHEWFNTSAFAIPTACFGDAPRNSIIGPGGFTINAGVTKTIPFGRDGLRRLDFSWNVSNLLNHPNSGGLSTVLGSKTFGEITNAGAMRSMTFTTRVNF